MCSCRWTAGPDYVKFPTWTETSSIKNSFWSRSYEWGCRRDSLQIFDSGQRTRRLLLLSFQEETFIKGLIYKHTIIVKLCQQMLALAGPYLARLKPKRLFNVEKPVNTSLIQAFRCFLSGLCMGSVLRVVFGLRKILRIGFVLPNKWIVGIQINFRKR